MAHIQPFYGKLSGVTPVSDNIVAITGNTTIGVNQITNIAAFNSSFNINLLRVGQTLNDVNGAFGSNIIISNISGTTLTVDANATSTQTGYIYTADTPNGVYLIQSSSFYDPQNFITVNDITGSNDGNFNGSTPIYAFIGQAATGTQASPGGAVPGRFHQYKITDVVYRDSLTAKLSAFIQWNEDDTQSASGDTLYVGINQSLPILGLTTTASLGTIFNPDITGLSDITTGGNVAGYQQALPNYFENLASGSSVTILNNANNRLTTATGNFNEFNAESNLTFDGSFLSLTGSLNIHSAGNASITTGQTEILSFPTTEGKSANFDYIVYNGTTDLRAGTIIAVWNTNDATYTDISTPDLNGSTEAIEFAVAVSAGDVKLFANVSSGTFDLDIATRIIF